MLDYLRDIWPAVRRWPLYSILVVAAVLTFVGSELAGLRLLGDDNETDANELVGAPRAGGHGGTMRFYHK